MLPHLPPLLHEEEEEEAEPYTHHQKGPDRHQLPTTESDMLAKPLTPNFLLKRNHFALEMKKKGGSSPLDSANTKHEQIEGFALGPILYNNFLKRNPRSLALLP